MDKEETVVLDRILSTVREGSGGDRNIFENCSCKPGGYDNSRKHWPGSPCHRQCGGESDLSSQESGTYNETCAINPVLII